MSVSQSAKILMMMIKCILLCLYLAVVYGTPETSLWDHIIKKEQVVLTVEYQGRHLNVWRQDSHGYSRFYVTPLCVMDLNSVNCSRDEYSKEDRNIFTFFVKLWDSQAAEAVQMALKTKKIEANIYDILPLPMQAIKIGLSKVDAIPEVDNQWRSNQDQPNIIPFELYIKDEKFCDKMVNDARNNPEQFFRGTKLYLEFTIVAGQQATRNFNVTGGTVLKSSFFTTLRNDYSDDNGMSYLQSKDMKKLAREIYNSAAHSEEVSSDYIPSGQESQIIEELLGILKENKIDSADLKNDEWSSVFWDDIFTRPDIQTEYANEVLKYDDAEKHFIFDAAKDQHFRQKTEDKYLKQSSSGKQRGGGFGFAGFTINANDGKTSGKTENKENSDDTESDQKSIIKLDDLQKESHKEEINVKWNGQKFTPKNFELYRLNTITMKSSNEIFFKRVVTTKYQSTENIEIKAEFKNFTLEKSTAGQMFFEDINNKIENLTAAMEQKLNEINQQITQSTSNTITNLNNAIANLQTQITETTNQINTITANYNGLRNEFNELAGFAHTQIGQINQNIANVQTHATNINQHADNILNNANHRINELKSQLKAGLFCVFRKKYCSDGSWDGVRDAFENYLSN